MYINNVNYNLECRYCNTTRENGLSMIESEKNFQTLTRNELITEMNNFKNVACMNCGNYGFWIVLKIYSGESNIHKQMKLRIFKENNIIRGGVEKDDFSLSQIELAFKKIREKIEMEFNSFFPSYSEEGNGLIVIDFLKNEPFCNISVLDLENITIFNLIDLMDYLQQFKTQKDISFELAKKLEIAIDDLLLERSLTAIAHLKNNTTNINLYLVAKDPNQNLFFGVLENDIERNLKAITLEEIRELDLCRIKMAEFNVNNFLKTGIKEKAAHNNGSCCTTTIF